MTQNRLNTLMDIIFNAPLWVQEVIYLDIKKHLAEVLPDIEITDENNCYSAMIPVLTFKGKKELETRTHGYDLNIYKYLKSANKGLRVIDITLNNFWTLEESSKLLAECLKNELIQSPENAVISSGIYYLGGEIRLGEYVKKLNIINVDQLDDVLRKQKQHNESNPAATLKIGEIMLDMGYIANNDIDRILHIKNEAKKRFFISLDKDISTQTENTDYKEMYQQIQKLLKENNLLKDKLRAVFHIQNKKA